MVALEAGRQLHVVLGDAADAAQDEAQLHVVALEPLEALGHGLQRTLHIGLEHDVERRRLAPLRSARRGPRAWPRWRPRPRLVPREAEALRPRLAERAGRGQVLGPAHLVAGVRRLGEPQHLHRRRGQRLFDVVAQVVDQRLDLAPGRAGHHRVADPQGALLHDDGGHRAPPRLEVGLEHDAAGLAFDAAPSAPRPRPPGRSARAGPRCRCPAGRTPRPRWCRRPTPRARARARRAAAARGAGRRRAGPSC